MTAILRTTFLGAMCASATVAILATLTFGCTTQSAEPVPTTAAAPTESQTDETPTEQDPETPIHTEPTPEYPDPATTRLETVVPPCKPWPGSTVDPCQRRSSWEDNTPLIYQNYDFIELPLPTFKETLLDGTDLPFQAMHFVVRATVIPGSTRCGWAEHYLSHRRAYASETSTRDGYAYCYHDLAVNEYLHGVGPSKLTINITRVADRENHPCDEKCLNDTAHYVERRIAYEGVEWIVFLGGPLDLGTSVWTTFDYYDVQRREDGETVVVSYWNKYVPRDAKEEWTLAEYRAVISDAYKAFNTQTGGRTGTERDRFGRLPPFFAIDAGPAGFSDYIRRSRMLEGIDITSSHPPPVPDEADSNLLGITINDIIATRITGGVKVTDSEPETATPTPKSDDAPTQARE